MLHTVHQGEKADIFVLNHFISAPAICQRLAASGVFENVVLVENKNGKSVFNFMKRIVQTIFLPKNIADVVKDRKYNEVVFFSNDHLMASSLVKLVLKNNKAAVFAFGEDGVGSYISDLHIPNTKVRLVLRLFNRSRYLEKINIQYVCQPGLMVRKNNLSLRRIPLPDFSGGIPDAYRSIFDTGEKDGYPYKEKAIYLQQPFMEDGLSDEYESEEAVLDLLNDFFGQDEFLVKLHLRSKAQRYEKYRHTKDTTLWEYSWCEQSLKNKLLITPISTAALSPKMFFGEEPVIIFTYLLFDKLMTQNPAYKNMIDFVMRFKDCYTNSDRIFIPQNLQELRGILENLNLS
jgi:hypothetical protein